MARPGEVELRLGGGDVAVAGAFDHQGGGVEQAELLEQGEVAGVGAGGRRRGQQLAGVHAKQPLDAALVGLAETEVAGRADEARAAGREIAGEGLQGGEAG